ncbi:RidA family protein [Macromonas nakdongensis]|uniref:RidA family protein n=1 Tax=Macromonas nakdongensis TaxID=1843082 RepID=UPI000C34AB45|nr:RidA family protein [Macromonas nakdongensis]
MHVYDRLARLGIALPPATPPSAAYQPFAWIGSLVFLSGHTAKVNGRPWPGRLGQDMVTADGQRAARQVAIDLLGTLQAAIGDLRRVTRLVKLTALVCSTESFTEQHLVTDGASRLFLEVFGPQGAHARSACGVVQIPRGSCLEMELIAEIGTAPLQARG